jgi:MtrB/PioB family decaheme-associated outer membrane protein
MDARDVFRLTVMNGALLAALAPAAAVAAEDPARPVSSIGVGLGYVDSDGARFGQYNGMNESGVYGLLDFSLARRDDATGTWLRFDGRNVGLESRQLRFEHNRQGNWGYFLEFGQIPRYEPYTVTTAVGGIGSNNLVVPTTPRAGTPFELKTRRDALGLGFEKIFSPEWDFKVRFKNEDKDGARVFGRGTTGGVAGFAGNFEFTPEPINSTTRQLDAVLSYAGERLKLAGGYYGTMYNNEYAGLNVAGGVAALSAPAGTAFTPIALPPDNSSHQFFLSGNYGFTPTTHGNFKVSYATATQDDAFVTGTAVPLAPGIGGNLQGKVETTFAQAGIVSRPLAGLALRADLRYEDRDDKTPVLQYFPRPAPASTSTTDGQNEPRSIRTTKGLLEASYLLPHDIRLTGGVDVEEKKRNTSPVRVVSYRETTDETSWRVELRRSMSETFTGAISYTYSDRDGSPFVTTTVFNGTAGSNLIAPLHLADRKRDKIRLSANWMPTEPLTISFYADYADDSYGGRDGSGLGPRSGDARNYALDAAYRFTDQWQANAWYNRNEVRAHQATCQAASSVGVCPATAADPRWSANLRNESDSFGVGFHGNPAATITVGADLSYSDISDSYDQAALAPATSTVPRPLPEITTRLTRLNLFGKYALEKNSGLRLDYIYDRFSTNDWTWTTWRYVDGTTLSQDPNQKVHFIGVSYYYRWQ